MDLSEAKNLLASVDENDIPSFLRISNEKNPVKNNNERGRLATNNSEGHYTSRCNISLMSNYLLYIVFITQTVAFNYFAFFSKGEDEPCYASS